MDKQTEQKLGKMDKKLVQLFEDLKDYSDTTLNKPPSEGTWSVLDTMQHLLLTEQSALNSIQREIDKNTAFSDSGFGDTARAIALRTALSLPIKFKAPFYINKDAFVENPTFWEVVKDWKNERIRLKQFCKDIPSELMQKSIYKHPVGGLLNMQGVLSFFDTHFDRHHKQIRRTLKKVDAVKQL